MSAHTPQSFVQAVKAAEREQWTGPACPAASSGCNGPHEGECLGLCTHRVDASRLTAPVRVVLGNPEPAATPVQRALATWRLYRRFRCSLRESFLCALRIWRKAN
jgi:hypothetical protein